MFPSRASLIQWASQTRLLQLDLAAGIHQTRFVSVDILVLSFRIRAHHPYSATVSLTLSCIFLHSCQKCARRVVIILGTNQPNFVLFRKVWNIISLRLLYLYLLISVIQTFYKIKNTKFDEVNQKCKTIFLIWFN